MKCADYIPDLEAVSIIDSTKLGCYKACPRRFFWEHLMGWHPAGGTSLHLVFGSAWHLAMEHLLLDYKEHGKYRVEAVDPAMDLFLEEYRKTYGELQDEVNEPKTPARARAALLDYVKEYQDESWEVLETEVAGYVPISSTKNLTFKIDVVVRDRVGGVWIVDHKTTGSDRGTWNESWRTNSQMRAYIHAASCYLQEPVEGAIINGAIFNKTATGSKRFKRVVVRKSSNQMNAWLGEAGEWLSRMEYDMHVLDCSDTEESYLHAFPQNDHACTDYGHTCPYLDFCANDPQPFNYIVPVFPEAQGGFEVRHWNPMEEFEGAKKIVELKSVD